jgi:hypothetical protein
MCDFKPPQAPRRGGCPISDLATTVIANAVKQSRSLTPSPFPKERGVAPARALAHPPLRGGLGGLLDCFVTPLRAMTPVSHIAYRTSENRISHVSRLTVSCLTVSRLKNAKRLHSLL